MANAQSKQQHQTGAVVSQPRTAREARSDAWRNTLTMLYDKFPLFAGVILVYLTDMLRRAVSLSLDGKTALGLSAVLIVAEGSLLVGLVLPKSILLVDDLIRGIGRIIETLAVTLHRAWYALRTGRRMAEDTTSSVKHGLTEASNEHA